MSLGDPQTVTVDGVAKTLNRISSEGQKSIYKTDDELYTLTISHQESGKGSNLRTRRMIRIDHRTVAENPLTSANEFKEAAIYLVVDEPEFGFTDDALDDIVQGFKTWLSTANVTKVLTNQH